MNKYIPDNELFDDFTVEPLTTKNWSLFVELFGDRGACGNCWCMYYRLDKATFTEGKADAQNKRAMQAIVTSGKPAGLLGLVQGKAIAWCAFAPREDFVKLSKSRVHQRIDDKQVWSIPCLFIQKEYRKEGLSVMLLKGVINYARENKIPIIEAYPTIPTQPTIPDAFAWIGLYKSFERAGFYIADHKSKNRPMVRYNTSAPQ